jgi:PhnB protein
MNIGIGLYVKNSAEAVEFYQKVFGLELGYHVKNPDGTYFHSELYKDGKEFLAVVEASGDAAQEHRVQLGVTLDNEVEVEKAFSFLCVDGTVKMPIGPLPWSPCAAEIIDKFGVWWFITAPMHHPAEDWKPE